MKIYNGTPHEINFINENGDEFSIPPSGEKPIDARPEMVIAESCGDYDLMETIFQQTDEGKAIIKKAVEGGYDVIVGSFIASQAYEEARSMIAAEGYERGAYVPRPFAELMAQMATVQEVLKEAGRHYLDGFEYDLTEFDEALKSCEEYMSTPPKKMNPKRFNK